MGPWHQSTVRGHYCLRTVLGFLEGTKICNRAQTVGRRPIVPGRGNCISLRGTLVAELRAPKDRHRPSKLKSSPDRKLSLCRSYNKAAQDSLTAFLGVMVVAVGDALALGTYFPWKWIWSLAFLRQGSPDVLPMIGYPKYNGCGLTHYFSHCSGDIL